MQQEELNKQLEEEIQEQERLSERLAKQREERQRLREEKEQQEREELARLQQQQEEEERAREAAAAAGAGSDQTQGALREEDEEQLVGSRDEDGRTQLHMEASVPGSNLKALLQQGYNLADRDNKGRTARDLAQQEGIGANIDILGEFQDLYVWAKENY